MWKHGEPKLKTSIEKLALFLSYFVPVLIPIRNSDSEWFTDSQTEIKVFYCTFSAHFQNRSIYHCDVGACLTSPIPLHGSTGPLCKHESAKWKCLYKNKVWNNEKFFE